MWWSADRCRMALIHEMRAAQASVSDTITTISGSGGTDIFFFSMARQNLQALLKAVELLEQYWAGVTSVATILEKRKSALFDDNTETRLQVPVFQGRDLGHRV